MEEKNNKPVKEVRNGTASVSIWENDCQRNGRDETFLTASVSKRYQDREGNWKRSTSFTKRELQDVQKAVQEALAFMEIHEHKERVQREAAEA